MAALRIATVLVVTLGSAAADPAQAPSRGPTPAPVAAASSTPTPPTALASPTPPSPPVMTMPALSPLLMADVPPPTVPSLRLEAARVAGEQFALQWRYPEPGPLLGFDGGLWYIGTGRYSPRSGRAAALHGGSVAATLIGEILLLADSPLAGVGALLTGATLDAAAADADRDAEARR